MATKVATGLALVFALAMVLMVLAEFDTLQDTGEAATSGNITSLLQTIAPISLIMFGGGIAIIVIMGSVALWRQLK